MKRLLLIAICCSLFLAGVAVGNFDWVTLVSGDFPVLARSGAIQIQDGATGQRLASLERNRVQLAKHGSERPQVNIAAESNGGYAQFSNAKGEPTAGIFGSSGTITARGYTVNAGIWGGNGVTTSIPYLRQDGTLGVIRVAGGIVVGVDCGLPLFNRPCAGTAEPPIHMIPPMLNFR